MSKEKGIQGGILFVFIFIFPLINLRSEPVLGCPVQVEDLEAINPWGRKTGRGAVISQKQLVEIITPQVRRAGAWSTGAS